MPLEWNDYEFDNTRIAIDKALGMLELSDEAEDLIKQGLVEDAKEIDAIVRNVEREDAIADIKDDLMQIRHDARKIKTKDDLLLEGYIESDVEHGRLEGESDMCQWIINKSTKILKEK